MKPYNQFSEEYNNLYFRNIIEFQKKFKEISSEDKSFVDFYPSFGIKENERTDFIIYGQAVNGWGSGFNIDEEINYEKIKNSINASNSYYKDNNHNPIDWVNIQWSNTIYNDECQDENIKNFYNGSYRTNKSFFWRVTYKLISDYYGLNRAGFEWSKKLVWSNLYKIAPDGANPSWIEKNLQQPLSAYLIKKEIEEIKPKFCVILTNISWWMPFREVLKSKIVDFDTPLSEIESVEVYETTKIIITKRPFIGNSDEFVKQILRIIGNN